MDDSKFYYQISRSLYQYRKQTRQILKSRTYALGNSVKIIAKEPLRFAGKSVRLVINDPKKLYRLVLGKQTIQRNQEIQENLKKEYSVWVKSTELSGRDVTKQKQSSKKFKKKPLVSLVTPVFNPPLEAHMELIESVLAQTYENFELLLFDFGDNPAVGKLLQEYAERDSRINVKLNLPNNGIGANSNYCLDYAKGEFLGLLDHDDALTPDALYECVKALNETETDFMYTDKDKITVEGQRFEPLFKPDWSPEMAMGGNYMTHFNLMRTSLVKKLGGWDPETDGAQDWDLFLRIVDRTKKPILHIPKVVYHWRTVDGSTSQGIGVKPYAINAQQLAVNKHLERLGVKGIAEHDSMGQLYIKWQSPMPDPLYIIKCLYNDFQNTNKLIECIIGSSNQHPQQNIQLFITEGTEIPKKEKQILAEFSKHISINYYNNGEFVEKVLSVVKEANKESIVYLEDSIKSVDNNKNATNWHTQLMGWLQLPGVNMAGCGVYGDTGQVVDVGSYYEPDIKNFVRYHFNTGLRSGYNGYLQWIRNFILPSSKIFVFSKESALEAINNTVSVRDDEFQVLLALNNFSKSGRAVYDPAVIAIDSAPFEIRLPLSSELNRILSTTSLIKLNRDPYYNPNLNKSYIDPKPNGLNEVEDAPGEYEVSCTN